jgi:hypothetical protein
MKNVRALVSFTTMLAAVLLLVLPMPAIAQNNAFDAQFGATPWAQNNVRTASAYNYILDGSDGSHVGFVFPANTCTNALSFGGRGGLNPFTTPIATGPTQSTPNTTVTITDAVSANTETVNLTSASIAGSLCTIVPASLNSHVSYRLSSGTCGAQEAVNDLGTGGGVVEYTQESVALGCKGGVPGLPNTTITGLKNVLANIYVHDISNGVNQWYAVKGTSLTLTAAPTALTTASTLTTATTGGSITNGAAIRAGIACLDPLGRETALSTDTAATAVVTTGAGSTNSITITAPGTTGCPNSVGYRAYLSAAGGATLSEILYAPSSSATVGNQCTASTTSIVVSACALTSNSVVVSLITGTAGIPLQGAVSLGLATATGLLPVSNIPTNPSIQTVYGPFSAITTVTTAQIAAEVPLSAGFFNTGLEKGYRITLSGVGTAAAATVAGTFITTLGPRQATGVQTIDTVNFTASTIWPAAAANWTYSMVCAPGVLGASGQLECQSDTGFIVSTTAAAAPPAFGPQLDNTTALSTAEDLTQQLYLDFKLTASASSFTTFTVRKVVIEPILY